MAGSSKGSRGSWRHQEILDLLDTWGEEKIQEQLRASHRNMDTFEQVAQEMEKRGYKRSAHECRSKTKAMRKEYRRVVNHNAKSGSNASTCLYFEQLNSILHGDATIRLKRIAGSLKIIRAEGTNPPSQPTAPLSLPEGSQGLFEEASEQSSTSLDINEEEVSSEEDQGRTGGCGGGDDAGEGTSSHSGKRKTPEPSPGGSKDGMDVPGGGDPGVPNAKATLSPASRLAQIRIRRSKMAGGDIAKQLMQHSKAENDRLLAVLQHDSEVFESYVAMARKQVQIENAQREALVRSVDIIATTLQGLLAACSPASPPQRPGLPTGGDRGLRPLAPAAGGGGQDTPPPQGQMGAEPPQSPPTGLGGTLSPPAKEACTERPKRNTKKPKQYSP